MQSRLYSCVRALPFVLRANHIDLSVTCQLPDYTYFNHLYCQEVRLLVPYLKSSSVNNFWRAIVWAFCKKNIGA